MKYQNRIFPFLIVLLLSNFSNAQLNMVELGALDIPTIHSTGLNDIWGYVDEEGNEYALVGAMDGVSIVNVTDPAAPEEVFWTPGLNSIWRDLKTHGDYAYVTTEALQGLMIIDMSGLPGDTDLPVSIYDGPDASPWLSAHNLYEADGYLYIFGAGRGNGGVIILDVMTDPMNPIEVGVFDDWYAHDGFIRDDTAYFAHIYEGFFSIVDLSDKTSPILLGTAITPTNFAHNIWASEDGNYVYTTDEVPGGYIGSFDVTDPASILPLDKIQSSSGSNVIPHNSHVKGNYLFTSYYTDGIVIHDITYPYNMVEVANHDTNPLDSPTTDGCWGAYPFLPSGNILATDREEGLFIFSFNEHQGSYLEGNITELGTGMALNNVDVTFEGTTIEDQSNVLGDYATGIESEGVMNVTYFKVLYFPQTIPVTMVNGVITEQDVVLERIPEFTLQVRVLDALTLDPIEGAQILMEHTYVDHEGLTDATGTAEIPLYYQDNYQVFGGKWGYENSCFVDSMITDELMELVIYIYPGYADDFTFDFGWNSTGTAARGFWEREIPVGVANGGGVVENPFFDIGFDCGSYAYMTGNGTTTVNTDEVNDGEVLLLSPVFDLTGYDTPYLNYSAWFFCQYGAEPDDTLEVYLLNGLGDTILVDQRFNGGLPMSQWNPMSIEISPLITPTATMQMLVILSDYLETENVTEGALDNFSITDFSLVTVDETPTSSSSLIKIYPNPFTSTVTIEGVTVGSLRILDIAGREVANLPIENTMDLPNLEPGTYFFLISSSDGEILDVICQIKK